MFTGRGEKRKRKKTKINNSRKVKIKDRVFKKERGKRLLSNFPIRSKMSNPLKISIIVSRTLSTLDNFRNAPIEYFIFPRVFTREDTPLDAMRWSSLYCRIYFTFSTFVARLNEERIDESSSNKFFERSFPRGNRIWPVGKRGDIAALCSK